MQAVSKILTTIEDLTEDIRVQFCDMIDDIILSSDTDPELKEGFNYLDKIALTNNMTFYNLILQMYEESELEDRVKDWLKKKGIDENL